MRKSKINTDNFGIPTDSSLKPIIPPRQKAVQEWYARERDDIPRESDPVKREPGKREEQVKRTLIEKELKELQVEPIPPRVKQEKAHSTTPQLPEVNRTVRRSLEAESEPSGFEETEFEAREGEDEEVGGIIPADSFDENARIASPEDPDPKKPPTPKKAPIPDDDIKPQGESKEL